MFDSDPNLSTPDATTPPGNILPIDGEAYLVKSFVQSFFGPVDADRLLPQIIATTPWRQDEIKIFGRMILQPRLTAWLGDPGASYRYSGLTMTPGPWTPVIHALKTAVESHTKGTFNSALINRYRTGMDSMGWHRDNEPELGPTPLIVSLSLGGNRLFKIRHYRNKSLTADIQLEDGDLLIMSGAMQSHWEHSLPKTRRPVSERINITFRSVKKNQ